MPIIKNEDERCNMSRGFYTLASGMITQQRKIDDQAIM